MHFTVTKEIDWEADDEAEKPKSGRGRKKRIRFIIDFSRRSSKSKGKKSNQRRSKSDLSEDYVDSENEPVEDNDTQQDQHRCYDCEQPRSELYHHHHPVKPDKQPRPSLCTQCRFFRNARIKNRANRRRLTESEARVDEREWCAGCGTLRSNEYHEKLLSGEAPPWNDICGRCMMRVEKKNNKTRRLRVYCYEEGVDDDAVETNDPLRESLRQRRSSPYAVTPTSSREAFRTDSAATSPSGPPTGRSSASSSPVPAAFPVAGPVVGQVGSVGQTGKPQVREKTPAAAGSAAVPITSGDTDHRQTTREVCGEYRPPHVHRREIPKPTNGPSQPSEPLPSTNGHTSRSKAQLKPEQQQSKYRVQQPPPARPMGISDMYWASEEGKAEETFTANGYFFPGAYMYNKYQEDEGSNGKINNNSTGYASSSSYTRPSDTFRPAGHTTKATTTAAASSEYHRQQQPQCMPSPHDHGIQAKIWEVDSDEADEIEEGHVNLLAGKGKARSRAAKKEKARDGF
ncbi:hypothetical protein N658DRAFT_153542 [Parathielavia hyrcaniae]|uniref:Uncharacterized protein n=1 Tax=Parathielavia hyrcaniae TaxID=113614 RepID=A0AAN6T0H5_9PEZI|nr:hypothetical protein N658DRAFT_153542 [Parathielavia hyrcaniae]